jgi:hypothetical protein
MKKTGAGRPPDLGENKVYMSTRVLPGTKNWIQALAGEASLSSCIDYLYLAVKYGYLDGAEIAKAIKKAKKVHESSPKEL